MSATLEFWYEFASTYSYPAAMRIEDKAREAGVPIVWRPFLLGPIGHELQGWTDSIFNMVPVKGRYMWRDLERTCAREGLAFNKPAIFPHNTIRVARLALLGQGEPWIGPFTRAVYEANFVHGQNIDSKEVLSDILERLGLDAAGLIAATQDKRVKDDLRAQVEAAKARGIFGAPSFVVDGELFWGFDRLDQALEWAQKAESTAYR